MVRVSTIFIFGDVEAEAMLHRICVQADASVWCRLSVCAELCDGQHYTRSDARLHQWNTRMLNMPDCMKTRARLLDMRDCMQSNNARLRDMRGCIQFHARLRDSRDCAQQNARLRDMRDCIKTNKILGSTPECIQRKTRLQSTQDCAKTNEILPHSPACLQCNVVSSKEPLNTLYYPEKFIQVYNICNTEAHLCPDWSWLFQEVFRSFVYYLKASFSIMDSLQGTDGLSDPMCVHVGLWESSVQKKCSLLALKTRRPMYFKHDFRCHLLNYSVYNFKFVNNLYLCFIVLSLLLFQFRCSGLTLCLTRWANILGYLLVPVFVYQAPFNIIGGAGSGIFSTTEIANFAINPDDVKEAAFYRFVEHTDTFDLSQNPNMVCLMPLVDLLPKLSVACIKTVAEQHDVHIRSRTAKNEIIQLFIDHQCDKCDTYHSIFSPIIKNTERHKLYRDKLSEAARQTAAENRKVANLTMEAKQNKSIQNQKAYKKLKNAMKSPEHKNNKAIRTPKTCRQTSNKKGKFPPSPFTRELGHTIISNFCKDTNPRVFMESGCAICGKLTVVKDLTLLEHFTGDLELLKTVGMTRIERKSDKEPIREISGPVIDTDCNSICNLCAKDLTKGNLPKHSLANGLWVGKVPQELQGLSYVEGLLIARIRHNRCVIQVSSGGSKLHSNAIAFANPTPKIYKILPPPVEELDDVLAFIFTGPAQPTQDDFKRTPLLVRRRKVTKALEWLKLNHIDYYDIDISYENINQYPEDSPPVVVDYRKSDTNKIPEGTSVHDMEDENGTETGDCPFVVHGLTGEELATKTLGVLKAIAMKHLNNEGKILAIGHSEKPESIYHNSKLYTQMFPWLFPYGMGGFGNVFNTYEISENQHKRHLLMYHDKRFQMDSYFLLMAFNHQQIKESTTGGYLLTNKQSFGDISHRLMNLDQEVLVTLTDRMAKGEHVKPESSEEKNCFQLIKDLDHVAGKVQGSLTSKKYMRNDIWSLTSYLGAPSWYITLSPADLKHPICLYYADTKVKFEPAIKDNDKAKVMIAKNPVAGARFFDYMIRMFIKHVLGVNETHPGLYGDTAGYYGTVEQQGRLTLHLHLLLWIRSSFTPQEIRDKIMDTQSDFQKKIVEYLESVHMGEFFEGTKEDVNIRKQNSKLDPEYKTPTHTLPEPPPPACLKVNCKGFCFRCVSLSIWWQKFRYIVDDLIFCSNVHTCVIQSADKSKAKSQRVGCINKLGKCKARFPRPTYESTEVDPSTGALNMKKGEAWINTVTPVLTYLFRCNTDVTSLLSGTAIKAVIAYVSDYITKPSLKSHVIFSTIKSVFDNSSELLGGTLGQREKSRKIITKIVNSLTSQLEIGAPMAALYLLGNPDHYTNYKFVPCYWKSYVREARSVWHATKDDDTPDRVVLTRKGDKLVGLTSVNDYTYRPEAYKDMSLYDWFRLSRKETQNSQRLRKQKKEKEWIDEETIEEDDELDLFEEPDDENTKIISLAQSDSDSYTDSAEDFTETDQSADELNIAENELSIEPHKEEKDTSDNNKHSKYHQFLEDHPLYETHHVYCVDDKHGYVPNFLGGTLPRCDSGDREYYCSTMLTLFRPWRSGRDLKSEKQSWDESFLDYQFTYRQKEIMKYFNIKYECLDARDDYSAQMKKNDQIGFTSWIDNPDEMAHTGQLEGDDDYDHKFEPETDQDITGLTMPGQTGKRRNAKMKIMEDVLINAGWLDKSPDGLLDLGDLQPIQPSVSQNGSKWKAEVQKKKQNIIDEKSQHMSKTTKSKHSYTRDPLANDVQIVDKSYLSKKFRASDKKNQDYINKTVQEFNLNKDQERAFRIIANHAVSKDCEQLKMYLGGMGGTGKSQVIKSLMKFFKVKNESHIFLVLAPTGSAAALLAGSTYHSILGIRSKNDDYGNATNQAKVKTNLEGVEYIFLDEVSMLSCSDMYRICAQLAKSTGDPEQTFGGINMIFAGDFAQLPPVFGGEGSSLYSGSIGTQIHSGLHLEGQKCAIGKAVWHQITTVVILRENMRQKSQTPEDAMLRQALENMRYKACSSQDIAFLRTLVSKYGPNNSHISEKRFRNVSIITAMNADKDKMNELGSHRFARENNLTLTDFYSIDLAIDSLPQKNKSKNPRGKVVSDLDPRKQEILWELPHEATEHAPGKLSLCIGLPVMIRRNEATELCITKGQEATVVGWQEAVGPSGQKILDTLFVELDNPPQKIQIDGLPENVVPLTRSKKKIICQFVNDDKITVERDQVDVLPNFAMTDYASQGKTRTVNVVHLNNCRSHHSYYTALSRSASAANTLIVQGFATNQITGGASGWLRQEFRELEILDTITRLRYEGKLPEDVQGSTRNTLIRSFQEWKGVDFVPEGTHAALMHGTNLMEIIQPITDAPWQVITPSKLKSKYQDNKSKNNIFVTAQGSKSLIDTKLVLDENNNKTANNKHKFMPVEITQALPASKKPDPVGLIWDGPNYSCAYDAVFTILCYIWTTKPEYWTTHFNNIKKEYLGVLSSGLKDVLAGTTSLENIRDNIRSKLHKKKPDMFPYGQSGTSIGELAYELMNTDDIKSYSYLICHKCSYEAELDSAMSYYFFSKNTDVSTGSLLRSKQCKSSKQICPECQSSLFKYEVFHECPKLITIDLHGRDIKLSKTIKVLYQDKIKSLKLRGMTYFGEYHFNARVISNEGKVWYHDGVETGSTCVADGYLSDFSNEMLLTCREKKIGLAIYG
jgi:hypothetical protein